MRNLLAWLVLLAAAAPCHAADALKIRDVRLGFVNVNEDFYKAGAWAPVTVEIENQIVGEAFEGTLTVESADSDGVLTKFSPRKVYIGQGEKQRTYLTYIKVSGSSADVKVSVRGRIGAADYQHTFNYPADRQGVARSNALQPEHQLILALGDPKGVEPPTTEEGNRNWEIGRNWHTAFQTNVNLLPDKWFGYEGVDVVILPTGGNWNGSMAQSLANDQLKRAALAQWVEMGGHLVISVSANHNYVGNSTSFPLEPLLPAEIDAAGTIKVDPLAKVKGLVELRVPSNRRYRPDTGVKSLSAEVARLKRRHPAQALTEEENPKLASIVQGSRGLGRVTLIAFDTDQGPFTVWENRRDFWPALLDIRPTRFEPGATPGFRGGFGYEQVDNDLAGQLCGQLEQFGEVRVIPFGWVALFIFVYILIVGPLDYLILKKVVKRLEWTWITFPLVVLAVSLGAYFLAHYLKGNELRINKIDIVEIDTHTQQAYGATWFTIFSPRLQHYQVGIEPMGFGAAEGAVVSWMGRPGYGARAFGQRQGPGFFSRSYEYENEAQSIKDVPIQVWSMKTFTGRWQAPLKSTTPLIKNELKTDRLLVEGSITSHLPFTLHNCQLIYGKSVWDLGTLEPDKQARLPLDYVQISTLLQSWGGATFPAQFDPRRRPPQFNPSTPSAGSLTGLLRQMMFYDEINRSRTGPRGETSDYLDFLDQSWRLEFPEAMLIGLLEDQDGSSNEINEQTRVGTRLQPFQPKLRGTLRQSTVVRIYLPVKLSGQ